MAKGKSKTKFVDATTAADEYETYWQHTRHGLVAVHYLVKINKVPIHQLGRLIPPGKVTRQSVLISAKATAANRRTVRRVPLHH